MAGFIRFSDSLGWSSSNWVYWGLMDHLLDSLADETVASNSAEECKWAQLLSFPILEKEDAESAKLIHAKLEAVVSRIVSGELCCKVDGRILDNLSQSQFREEAARLQEMMCKIPYIPPR